MTDSSLHATIAANLADIRHRMAGAAARSGRRPDEVCLIAVSKTFGADHVRAAFAAGQRDFGENRVQEALHKIAETAEAQIRWHLIGHLQSNKVRKAVGPFAAIHSVDSLELLRRLEALAVEAGIDCRVLLQVDLAGETSKHAAPPADVERMLEFGLTCRRVAIGGLMLLPPMLEDLEAVRPYFRQLRELRDQWQSAGVPAAMLGQLSMGMSHDFEVAIEEGATHVRIGTAVFGARAPQGQDDPLRSPAVHVADTR
jgi:pyridoxal phosphate enzyme (YggS family)